MVEFCENCQNRMVRIFAPSGLQLQCRVCGTTAKSSDAGTLIMQRKTTMGEEIYQTIPETIYSDPANPIEEVFCPQCGKNVLAKYIRVTDKMIKNYACKAGHLFKRNAAAQKE